MSRIGAGLILGAMLIYAFLGLKALRTPVFEPCDVIIFEE